MSMHSQTDWCSPPGTTIQDVLNERKIGLREFADLLGQSYAAVEQLLSGKLSINHDLAILLADIIGASPRFWMQREIDYRQDQSRLATPSNIVQKQWLSKIPVTEMMSFGWIPSSRIIEKRFESCLEFFGVRTINEWESVYSSKVQAIAFRSSDTFEQDPVATSSWLRFGEIEAERIKCRPWNKNKFRLALHDIRKLTRIKDPNIFLPKLRLILADCGVAFVVARTPTGCRASGATRFLTPEKALMILSFRYRSDDHFWFTFFHEAAHLILHDASHIFLEGNGLPVDREELEANQFSQDILIPESIRPQLYTMSLNFKSIIRFAAQIGVSAGVVVGQLQFLKIVDTRRLNFLKRRYDWSEITVFSP